MTDSDLPAFPLPRSARLAVFASGRGSNLASLLSAFPARPAGQLGHVELVIVNVPGAGALQHAQQADVATRLIPWTKQAGDREGFEREAQAALDEAGIDLICLAGFMRILSPSFAARWQGRIVNVHPSLLPAYPGLRPQRRALQAGERESGCTIHLVDAGVDSGPILLQRRVQVRAGDDEESLSARILEMEHRAYPEAVSALLRGEVPRQGAKSPSTQLPGREGGPS